MNVYKDLLLEGIQLDNDALHIALRVKHINHEQIDGTNRKLMYGNLLCLSFGGNFLKPIWATVSSREMLKKNIVVIEICREQYEITHADFLFDLLTEINKGTKIIFFFIKGLQLFALFFSRISEGVARACDNPESICEIKVF